MVKSDLHIHSNYSDGSDSIPDLVENIKQAGICKFSLTDHDTNEGCFEIVKHLPNNMEFIWGIELTCKIRDIKCHILGYNYDPTNKELQNLIELGKRLRRNKLEARIEYLKKIWNIELTENELNWLYSRKSVVKTHLANILVQRGLAENNLSAMAKYLDGCKTNNTRFDGEQSIQVIKNAGGTSVWAHPLGGEGEKHLSKEEFIPKLNIMIEAGIQGLECAYSRYSKKEIEFLTNCANLHNLIITGGSDYHGKNKDIPLGKLCSEE